MRARRLPDGSLFRAKIMGSLKLQTAYQRPHTVAAMFLHANLWCNAYICSAKYLLDLRSYPREDCDTRILSLPVSVYTARVNLRQSRIIVTSRARRQETRRSPRRWPRERRTIFQRPCSSFQLASKSPRETLEKRRDDDVSKRPPRRQIRRVSPGLGLGRNCGCERRFNY